MTIATLDLDQLLGVAGAMMEAMGGIVNMEFSGFSSETISEEPGGQILGIGVVLG